MHTHIVHVHHVCRHSLFHLSFLPSFIVVGARAASSMRNDVTTKNDYPTTSCYVLINYMMMSHFMYK